MKKLHYKKQIAANKKHVDVSVSVISFIDYNTPIIYCPALDACGYGIDETEAKESFDLTLTEYLNYTFNKGTIWSDLKSLRWNIKKTKTATAIAPAMKNLLDTNKEFSKMFDNYPIKKFNTNIAIPAIN